MAKDEQFIPIKINDNPVKILYMQGGRRGRGTRELAAIGPTKGGDLRDGYRGQCVSGCEEDLSFSRSFRSRRRVVLF
jgi:hypothetical protein